MPSKADMVRAEYNREYGRKNHDRIADQRRSRRLRDPESVRRVRRASMARTKYGLSLEQYESMIASGCGICGKKDGLGSGRMAIDHDHGTGKVRGALCANCNQGLGRFQDSPKALRRAIRYLGEWA